MKLDEKFYDVVTIFATTVEYSIYQRQPYNYTQELPKTFRTSKGFNSKAIQHVYNYFSDSIQIQRTWYLGRKPDKPAICNEKNQIKKQPYTSLNET